MFWEKRGGGLIRQRVGTATITAANRVDLVSFSSRCWSFWRTHEHRPYSGTFYPASFTLDSLLALTISAQCKTDGWCSTPGPMTGGNFLRRKKRCAGAVGTRTDWVLKREEGGMTTPLLQYVARFDGGGEILRFGGEVTRRVGHGASCSSDSRLYLLRQAVSN